MKRHLLAGPALAAAAVLTLGACSGDDATAEPAASSATSAASETQTPSASSSPSEESSSSASAEASEGSSDAAPGKLETIKASSPVVTDPVLKTQVKVEGLTFGYKGEGERVNPPGDKTYVLVKYNVKTDPQIGNGTSCSNMKLSSSESSYPQGDMTSLHRDKLKKDNLPRLESVRGGDTATGWCLYYVDKPTKDNLTVTYTRIGLKDSGTGKTWPKFQKEAKITAA